MQHNMFYVIYVSGNRKEISKAYSMYLEVVLRLCMIIYFR